MRTLRYIAKWSVWMVSACLLIVVGTVAVKLWPRTVPFDQCGEIYQKYADREDIDVTFVKDYKVNDTVFVDVTMVEAKDSAAWALLCVDFDVLIIPEEYRELFTNNNAFNIKRIPDNNSKGHDNDSTCIMVASYKKQELCFFHTGDRNNLRAIMDMKTGELR